MNKKLKIAIIGSRGYPFVYSGYETLVKELSERLIKKGHQVRVYCHKPLFNNKPRFVNGIELIYIPSIETKFLSGLDSLYSILQMPKGFPVSTMAIGETGAKNAAIMAISILSCSNKIYLKKLKDWRKNMTDQISISPLD